MIEMDKRLFPEYGGKRYSPYIYQHGYDEQQDMGDGLSRRIRHLPLYAVWDDVNFNYDGITSSDLERIKGICDLHNIEWELYCAKITDFLVADPFLCR